MSNRIVRTIRQEFSRRRPAHTGLAVALLCGLLAGCGGEAEVVSAPAKADSGTATIFCSGTEPCPTGMMCEQGVCIDEGPGFGQPDTTRAPEDVGSRVEDVGSPEEDGGSLCDNIPNAPGCVDVVEPEDVGTEDTQVDPDTNVATDAGPADTGAPDVPVVADECSPPGFPTACDFTDEVLDGCRIDEGTKAASCTTSTNYGLLAAPCLDNSGCDLLLGCHFGQCAPYCNLGFGTLVNGGGVCPALLPTCKSVGHPQYGACAAQ